MLQTLFTVVGGVAGAAGVLLGALTAHAFKARLDAAALGTLETVSSYLLVHGLLLVVIAALQGGGGSLALKVAGILAVTGIILFCGGLSARILAGVSFAGGLAPAGGLAFMGAWLALAIHALIKT